MTGLSHLGRSGGLVESPTLPLSTGFHNRLTWVQSERQQKSQAWVMRDGAVLCHLPPDGVNRISNVTHGDIQIKRAPGCEAKLGEGCFRGCLYCQRNGFQEEEKQGHLWRS